MDLPDFQNAKEWLRAFRGGPKKSKILTISILLVVVPIILVVFTWPIIRSFIGQKSEPLRFLITNSFVQATSTIFIEAESNSANSNRPLKIEYDGYVMKNAGTPIPDTDPQMWRFTLYDGDLPEKVLEEGTHELRFGFLGENFSESSRIFISKKAHVAITDVVKPKFPSIVSTESQTIEVDSAREFIETIQPNRMAIYNEDFFANRVLWDSHEMTKDSPAKGIDIELKNVQCLMLVFDGKDVLGNWADASVINEGENK